MHFAKRFANSLLMGLGMVAIVAVVLSLSAPKAVHGVVAALVQVTNTTANPVPTVATDNPAEEPFSAELITRWSPTAITLFSGEQTVPMSTPDGKAIKRMVIETVSVECDNFNVPASGIRLAAPGVEYFLPFAVGADPVRQISNQTTRIYLTPGDEYGFNVLAFEGAGVCSYTVGGHYVTQ